MYFSRKGVTTPVCGITGAQQLGRAGWSELRNLSDTEPPFRLFRDEGRTFLQVRLNWNKRMQCNDIGRKRILLRFETFRIIFPIRCERVVNFLYLRFFVSSIKKRKYFIRTFFFLFFNINFLFPRSNEIKMNDVSGNGVSYFERKTAV